MINGLIKRLLRYPAVRAMAKKIYAEFRLGEGNENLPELGSLSARPSDLCGSRINLLVPAVSAQYVFGGVATALALFERLRGQFAESRIIVTDEWSITLMTSLVRGNWQFLSMDDNDATGNTIITCGDRSRSSIPIRGGDIFVATAWWTAYAGFSLLEWQTQYYGIKQPRLAYLIQDFEPGFYPWSSRYALADLTYRYPDKTIGIFNTHLLADFFSANNIAFPVSFTFEPKMDGTLLRLRESRATFRKTRTLLFYGRPSVERNAYALAIGGLRFWAAHYSQAHKWRVLSVGEAHSPVALTENLNLVSLGKLSLSEYADLLCATAVGLSLMISPHPSYPPLELAAFGAKVITNRYANKDLSSLSASIYSVQRADYKSIGEALAMACNEYDSERAPWEVPVNKVHLSGEFLVPGDPFAFAPQLAEVLLGVL